METFPAEPVDIKTKMSAIDFIQKIIVRSAACGGLPSSRITCRVLAEFDPYFIGNAFFILCAGEFAILRTIPQAIIARREYATRRFRDDCCFQRMDFQWYLLFHRLGNPW